MTKLSAVVGIFVVAILISASAYVYSENSVVTKKDTDITAMVARREDLLTTQQHIAEQLTALNESVQQAVAKQAELTKQMKALDSGATVSTTTTIPTVTTKVPEITTPQVTVPKPAPVVNPPRPVTRAS